MLEDIEEGYYSLSRLSYPDEEPVNVKVFSNGNLKFIHFCLLDGGSAPIPLSDLEDDCVLSRLEIKNPKRWKLFFEKDYEDKVFVCDMPDLYISYSEWSDYLINIYKERPELKQLIEKGYRTLYVNEDHELYHLASRE